MAGLDVYTRPYVPQELLEVNLAHGIPQYAADTKAISYEAYVATFAGTTLLKRHPKPCSLFRGNAGPPQASPLSPKTYESYFYSLLETEIASREVLNKSQGLYMAQLISQGEYHALEVPGVREDNPMLLPGDVVELRPLIVDTRTGRLPLLRDWPWNGPPGFAGYIFYARIQAVQRSKERIVLGLDANQARHFSHFNVSFLLQQHRYEAYEYSLPRVQEQLQAEPTSWMRSMLFPCSNDGQQQTKLNSARFSRTFLDRLLNYEQKRAVDTIYGNDYGRLPFLLSGPPGTGKTKTLVEVVSQLLQSDLHESILVCAPSESAADTLTKRLVKRLDAGQLLRLNPPARTFAEVPDEILPYCYVAEDVFTLPPFDRLMQFRVVVTTCRDAAMLVKACVTNQDLWHLGTELMRMLRPNQSISEPAKLHWTALCVDEAAQATEPEVLAALCVMAPPSSTAARITNPQFIMAGDEHQLGPKTASHSRELEESLFSRLSALPLYADHPLARGKAEASAKVLTKEMLPIARPPFVNLVRNYRSHPAIIAIPSSLFYFDTLIAAAPDIDLMEPWDGWQGRQWPVLFMSNMSTDYLERDGGGWFNPAEVNIAITTAERLVASGLVSPADICIMSPFSAQVRRLRDAARQSSAGLWQLNIGPTEAFQGLESRMVILCTTRSQKRFIAEDVKLSRGLIHQPRRLNVSLTRAKQGLIVIGNPQTLREDRHWGTWLDFCNRNGLGDKNLGINVQGPRAATRSCERAQVDLDGLQRPTRLERQLLLEAELARRADDQVDPVFGRRLGDQEEASYAQGLAIEDLLAELDMEDGNSIDSDEDGAKVISGEYEDDDKQDEEAQD